MTRVGTFRDYKTSSGHWRPSLSLPGPWATTNPYLPSGSRDRWPAMSTITNTTEAYAEGAKKEVDTAADEGFDTTDSSARYLAYASRINTAIRAGSRYLAYTSDVGEAFRPVVAPYIVRAGYGISWAYVLGDVGYETYKAYRKGPTPLEAASFSEPTRLAMMATKRGTFQAIASMGLPALTIHTVVRVTTSAFKDVKNARLKAWGPTVTGLAIVPFLPLFFDKPVEHVIDRSFEWVEEQIRKEERSPKGEL